MFSLSRHLLACFLITLLAGPASAGFDRAKLALIRPALEAEVAAGRTNGIVALVLHEGRVVLQEAVGWADREAGLPMRTDSVFWIASMTKSVSATAVLTLVDEGRLSLDAPASAWLPELGQVKFAAGSPPARPITLRDLLSHTSGIRFPLRSPADGASSLRRYVGNLVRAPLSFEPGSRYEYNFGITVAGRMAEVVTGRSFEQFMDEQILKPLGMNDTTFHPDSALRSRIVRTYTRSEESGGLVPAYNPFVTPDPAIRHMPEPSGGLFSTAKDMARFYQMVLDGGVWEGRRILSVERVAEMLRPHTAGGQVLNYGLGWMIHTERQKPIKALPVGSYGHGGAFFTNGWVVPEERLVVVMMMQHVLVPESGQVRDRFYELVGAALGSI